MRYLIFSICLLFYINVSAQNKKSPIVVCDKGDATKGHPTLSAVSFVNGDPAHMGEQVWFIMLNGKAIFNFKWKQKEDSKLDFAKGFSVRSVNIKLDNDSLVVLHLSSRPQLTDKDYLWVQSQLSFDKIKQFADRKMVGITLVIDDNVPCPLFSFNEAEQQAIEGAAECFLSETGK